MSSNGRKLVSSIPAALLWAIALIQVAHLVYFDPFPGYYGDTIGYVSAADSIFQFRNFASHYQPLYPAFLRIATMLSDYGHFRRFVVLLQIGMIVGTCILVYYIVLRLTEKRWAATVAALLLALDIAITIYEYIVLTETSAIFLSVLFIYASFLALVEGRRRWVWLAAFSLLGLALTKFGYVPFAFAAGVVSVAAAWVLRKRPDSASLRRYALALFVVCVLLGAKLSLTYRYTGAVSVHGAWGLAQFLDMRPDLVMRLSDSDPGLAKLKTYYAANGHLAGAWLMMGGKPTSPEFVRAMTRAYFRVWFTYPIDTLGIVLHTYYRQRMQNLLFCYPEETNYRYFGASGNALFTVEKIINRAIFGSWLGLGWTSLCLVLAAVLLFVAIPLEKKLLVGLLLALIFFSLLVSTVLFSGTWIGDNTRMRLMYEAPAVALWLSVPYLVIEWRRRPRKRAEREGEGIELGKTPAAT